RRVRALDARRDHVGHPGLKAGPASISKRRVRDDTRSHPPAPPPLCFPAISAVKLGLATEWDLTKRNVMFYICSVNRYDDMPGQTPEERDARHHRVMHRP